MSLGLGNTLVPKSVSVALAIGLLAAKSLGQQMKVLAPHKPIPPKAAKQIKGLTPAAQRSMVGGLWMTDANFKSSIYLRNGVETDPITVTPILHLSNGTKYTLADVKVEPAGIAIVDINDELSKLGISPVATLSGYLDRPDCRKCLLKMRLNAISEFRTIHLSGTVHWGPSGRRLRHDATRYSNLGGWRIRKQRIGSCEYPASHVGKTKTGESLIIRGLKMGQVSREQIIAVQSGDFPMHMRTVILTVGSSDCGRWPDLGAPPCHVLQRPN